VAVLIKVEADTTSASKKKEGGRQGEEKIGRGEGKG
jgi:hypothetical protein